MSVSDAQVTVRYKGTHKGKVFDESKGKGFTFRLGEQCLLGLGALDFCALPVTTTT